MAQPHCLAGCCDQGTVKAGASAEGCRNDLLRPEGRPLREMESRIDERSSRGEKMESVWYRKRRGWRSLQLRLQSAKVIQAVASTKSHTECCASRSCSRCLVQPYSRPTSSARCPCPACCTDPIVACVCAEFPHDTGIMSGPYDNPFDDGSFGTEYIQNIEDLPQYDWTYGQADDMCPDCTPTTLAE